VLVISAGVVDAGSFGARWLGMRPLAAIGTMSYSLYLWHWPLLVAADALPGPLRRRDSLAVVAISLIPAYLSYRFVEQRWRHADSFVTPPSRGLRYGLLLTVFGVVAGTALFVAVPESYFGVETLRPNPLNAMEDVANLEGDECDSEASSNALTCTFGIADSEIEVVLVGDSHAVQWIPALEPMSVSNGWSLATMTKSGCQLADVVIAASRTERPDSSCIEWNDNVVSQLIDSKPDLVVAAGIFWPTLIGPNGILDDSEIEMDLTRGLESTWSVLSDAGIKVVAIRDVPHPPFDIAECVVENPLSPESCSFDLGDAIERNTPHIAAAGTLGLGLIDLTNEICSSSICPAVKGDILVWRDASHLTATYSALLAGVLEAKLLAVAPNLTSVSDS